MKELKNIFQPEISPIHKRDFSIASQLTLTGADLQKQIIPAGTILKSASATANQRIELDPDAGVSIALAADSAKPLGVLMHDVVVSAGEKQAVGILIKGVVYDDVMKAANGDTNWTDAVKKGLLPYITTYKVNTMKA